MDKKELRANFVEQRDSLQKQLDRITPLFELNNKLGQFNWACVQLYLIGAEVDELNKETNKLICNV